MYLDKRKEPEVSPRLLYIPVLSFIWPSGGDCQGLGSRLALALGRLTLALGRLGGFHRAAVGQALGRQCRGRERNVLPSVTRGDEEHVGLVEVGGLILETLHDFLELPALGPAQSPHLANDARGENDARVLRDIGRLTHSEVSYLLSQGFVPV